MPEAGQLDLGVVEAAPARPRPRLPQPRKLRFQPQRAGILNIWQYGDQELCFHDGRLILRGENGSGKSKALEVLLPFLLDADLSPYRLDPFQGQGRSMRWNLLEGGRHESRVGYVWLELGRRPTPEEDGEPVFVTLGCGLQASRRGSGVDAWYFISQQRVGEDLALLTSSRQPLSKKQLRQALGERGTVFQNATEYRSEVDRRLFDLGADRFAALRHLLLQLRRPQLSEKLDPGKLSELLGKSLPPIEEDLIGELADLFERLAQHEKDLVRLRAAIASVEAFLEIYRQYSRGVARGRADAVRQSESRHQAKAAELRVTEEEAETLEAQLTSLERREAEQRAQLDAVRGEIRALEQSEAMQAAQALAAREEHTRTLEEQAERDVADAARSGGELAGIEAEQQTAEAEQARRAEEVAEPTRRAAKAADRVGLEAVNDGAAGKLSEDAIAHDDAARGAVRAAVRERQEAAVELSRLARARRRAEEAFRRGEERRREADEQVRAAHEREAAAHAAVDAAAERLDDALVAWAEGCLEVDLGDDELDVLRGAVRSAAEAAADLQAAVAEFVGQRRDRLISERTALEARLAELRDERVEVVAERQRVDEARELGPQPPRWREAPRAERPGAPFYALVDFADDLDSAQRAGLEAALEAAGLLDAWVCPDGRLLDPEKMDTVLVPQTAAKAEDARTLADVLVLSDANDAVDAAVVEGLLASVAVGPEAVAPDAAAAAAVDLNGRFRLGLLSGRWTKPEPEHLGSAAREAARQRRLAELDAQLAELAERITEIEAQQVRVGERLERLAAEAKEAPRDTELASSRHAATAATADLGRRRQELTEAEAAVAAARRQRDNARLRLEAKAGELRLAAWLDDLEGFREAVRVYQIAFEDLARAHVASRQAVLAAERLRARAEATRQKHGEAKRRADTSQSAARSARAEVDALQATVGVEAREVIERHGRAVGRREALDASLAQLGDDTLRHRERRAVVEERLRHQSAELAERDEARHRATESLRRLVELGFLGLVLEQGEDFSAELATHLAEASERSWPLRRSLGIARAIARQTADLDLSTAAADRRTNQLMLRYRELEGEIGGDFASRLDQDGELLVFRVRHQQRDQDGPALADALRQEVAEREGELAEDERELMRRILLGDVGDHLRGRLRQAHDLVRRMNKLLVACPTASGMTLRLSWRPDEEADAGVRQVLELLLRDPELLGDPERRALEGFFQARVEEARRDNVLVPWREHLLEALDYRRWHRFRIERRMSGESSWSQLTQRSHAASSGGEKAVALHLPLFAAAAAHYQSASDVAPQLILLDEAFAGIDAGMRGRCMALLVDFDLDFMMTSYDEWGCYEELPGVATYQLYRDAVAGGVEAIRFVWNGERLVEDEAP